MHSKNLMEPTQPTNAKTLQHILTVIGSKKRRHSIRLRDSRLVDLRIWKCVFLQGFKSVILLLVPSVCVCLYTNNVLCFWAFQTKRKTGGWCN